MRAVLVGGIKRLMKVFRRYVLFFIVSCGLIVLLRLNALSEPGWLLTGSILLFALAAGYLFHSHAATLAAFAATAFALWMILAIANELKISAVRFPLTTMDLKIFASDPTGLLDSVSAPRWLYSVMDALPIICAIVAAIVAYFVFRKVGWNLNGFKRLLEIATKIAVITAIAPVFFSSVAASVDNVRVQALGSNRIPDGESTAEFARKVGLLAYLIHSNYVEDEHKLITSIGSAPLIGPQKISRSIDRILDVRKLGRGPLPNIMIVHAESTFDPNDVLKLRRPVENSLFYLFPGAGADQRVHLHTAALVNTIGGSSWITEFEVLHGIDSRLFGAAGRYAHSTLSNRVAFSFPRYLTDRGYVANAYTVSSSAFYGAGKAYLRYGFRHFYDRNTIRASPNDREIMEKALQIPDESRSAPFLKYVLLTENHSPHQCKKDIDYDTVELELDDAASHEQNCALKEYVRRAISTESAIKAALAFLEDAETRTGRPYVLAVYGDHQPYTFTGGGTRSFNLGLDFSSFYKDQSKRKTIFKLFSSKENPFRCCTKDVIPITMLPSLISVYVATTPDDLYLPIDFFQFDRCGSDWLASVVGTLESKGNGAICPEFGSILSSYYDDGVLKRD